MSTELRVAVVGAGPSGIYCAEALTTQSVVPARVDVFDRLPSPYGLVRYGVAPDHLKMKSVVGALAKVMGRERVRFIGNVDIGVDVPVDVLAEHYHAIVWCYGASTDRPLGIDGEELPGSTSAARFVNWYCGHPDRDLQGDLLAATSVAVIGNGNVAVDIGRILAKDSGDLLVTDMHDEVLGALAGSQITDISLIGRGDPLRAKWTTKELRELGELADVDVIVNADDLVLDARSEELYAERKDLARNLDILRGWSQLPPRGARRRLHLRFFQRPAAVVGTDHVSALRLERTKLEQDGRVVGTGFQEDLPVEMIVRAAGYRGRPLGNLPFDESSGTMPNDAGRVRRGGDQGVGHYAAGWIKRGPSGVIGTNRVDAAETVASIVSDADRLLSRDLPNSGEFEALMSEHGATPVTWDDWLAIDAAEVALGAAVDRARIKIADRSDLLAVARTR
ncbi:MULTISPECIES: NAD(P)-binding protein [unclassified Nocardioides]|uniref:NAD(P)-binding protein n=1 Tax=unclassified Nocardioides TaxID=2615069 RepID=UPI0006FD9098|nr:MULTISPECIES: FAD/NAD(P)-binding protein [unclassified Nocardioides]KRA31093.1 hypothetical protein ASD81_16545 [Nocardioides sp. Root614]KRA87713.1 hypothetical protein ASD84_16815 [Nocardioides sp. Root682]